MLTEIKRPKKLSDVLGQVKAVKFARSWIDKYKDVGTADAFLVHGPSGAGKTSLAHAICGELGCDWGFQMIQSKDCTIDRVRELREDLHNSMLNGERWRVILVDECHVMTNDAKNAFLSLLENLPAFRLMIFTTTEPLTFDLVWRSRCKMISVESLDEDTIVGALTGAADRQVPPSVLGGIAATCAGNLRQAYHELEKHLLTVTKEEDEQAQATHEIVEAIADDKNKAEYKALVNNIAATGAFRIKDLPMAADEPIDTVSKALTIKPGTKDGYIEIHFKAKPDEAMRNRLKASGYRWSRFNSCWYGKSSRCPLTTAERAGQTVEQGPPAVNPYQNAIDETKLGNKERMEAKAREEADKAGIEVKWKAPVVTREPAYTVTKAELRPVRLPNGKISYVAENVETTDYPAKVKSPVVPQLPPIEGMSPLGITPAKAPWVPAFNAETAPEVVTPVSASYLPADYHEKTKAKLAAAAAPKEPRSWKVGVKTRGDKDWVCNGCRYATKEQASNEARDLAYRWTAVNEHTVLPSEDEVNYDAQGKRIEPPKKVEDAPQVVVVAAPAPQPKNPIVEMIREADSGSKSPVKPPIEKPIALKTASIFMGGLCVSVRDGKFYIAHVGSGMDIGIPEFESMTDCSIIMAKVSMLADWTKDPEEVMAIDGLQEKIQAVFEEKEPAESPVKPAPVKAHSENVVSMPCFEEEDLLTRLQNAVI